MVKEQNKWVKHLMSVYEEMKKKNPETKFKDAMPVAKASYKK